MEYLYLAIAIVSEVIATSSLKATEGFRQLGPTLIVVVGYVLSFYFLTLSLQNIPMGIAYAIWSGIGIVLIAIAGVVLYKQQIDLAAVLGMALIVAGVLVINLFSKTTVH
jgi:small multidrug resistance pump